MTVNSAEDMPPHQEVVKEVIQDADLWRELRHQLSLSNVRTNIAVNEVVQRFLSDNAQEILRKKEQERKSALGVPASCTKRDIPFANRLFNMNECALPLSLADDFFSFGPAGNPLRPLSKKRFCRNRGQCGPTKEILSEMLQKAKAIMGPNSEEYKLSQESGYEINLCALSHCGSVLKPQEFMLAELSEILEASPCSTTVAGSEATDDDDDEDLLVTFPKYPRRRSPKIAKVA